MNDAASALDSLRVSPRPPAQSDYRRAAFGTSWSDTDGNGCNQRDDVLQRDAVPGSLRVGEQGRCDHDVLAGRWVDPYSGADLELDDLKDRSQAQAVQVDHVVPLAEAWVSGARGWSDERRRLFANDLEELLAVSGRVNASKGSGDPAAWRPRKAYQCSYARKWIATKQRWDLAVDPSEVRALREMLAFC
ncbi:HNH endonuclease family protein [Marmoricola sp. RAF53]|uniref:HNH endonuclease family protein n=1 Tax=Marmoricola sp. RAF53 TaxID=3233059 RepID=UPI003F959DCD